MSFESAVYGYIEEVWVSKAEWFEKSASLLAAHNNIVLKSLTANDF